MRKNLHYKVLASVLAIAGLYFYNATAISIDDNKIVGQSTELQETDSVYGNYKSNEDANGANVTIKNKSNLAHVYGGFSDSANANNNVVNIDNSTSLRVFGGYANGKTENSNANGNKVIISDSSTIKGESLYGGWSGYGSASGNIVTIENSTATNSNIWIIGGYAPNTNKNSTISATGNTVKLIGSTNVENADIYGGRTDNSNPAGIDVTTGNKLILENWSGSVKSVQNFSDIYLNNITWQTDNPVLNITANTVTNALANTNINLNSLNFTGGTELNEGESMTFVNGENLGLQEDKVKIDNEFTAGVATVGSGMIEVANDNNSIKYTLTEVKTNKQIDLVAENRAVAAAFVN